MGENTSMLEALMRIANRPFSKYIISTAVLGGIAALSGCGPKALISGKVLDNFGVPLEGVSVVVEGTQFQAVTSKSGAYKITYAPGTVRLSFTKAGYFAGELSLNLATETKVPAKDVTVFKAPPGVGLYLVGKSDYEPLAPGELTVNQSGFMGIERTYSISGKATPVLVGGRMVIVDNDRKNQAILGIQPTNMARIISRLESPASLIGPDTYLWDISAAKPGDYAFVTVAQNMMIGTIFVDPVYRIAVRNPESSAKQ